MPDLKPPRVCGDERQTLLALLQFQRESMLRKVDGLDDDAARHRFVGSETTLLWLLTHLSHAEALWLRVRFRGEPESVLAEHRPYDDTLAAAVATYRRTWQVSDSISASSSLDDVVADDQGLSPVNLRWILGHLLEETARHAGHADILRELVDGSTGR